MGDKLFWLGFILIRLMWYPYLLYETIRSVHDQIGQIDQMTIIAQTIQST